MSRFLLPLLMVLAGVVPAQAQSSGGVAEVDSETKTEEPPPPPDEIITIEPPTERMTTNIAFIVDTSGSMDNNGRVGQALTFSRSLIERPMDQLMVALLAFKDAHFRWPGLTPQERAAAQAAGALQTYERPPPKGWVYFPGVPELESAQRWLSDRGASGGTNPISALNEVLAEKVRDLTVVLITDGEDFDIPGFKKAVADGQKAREEAGLGKAVIFVIGVGPNAHTRTHLREVGRDQGGGFFHVRRPPPPEPDPEEAPFLPDVDLDLPYGPILDDD